LKNFLLSDLVQGLTKPHNEHILLWEVKFMCNCNCRISCNLLSIVAGIIIGIITAFLSITAVITVTPAFLWVALGIAVVYLATILLSTALACNQERRLSCLCPTLSAVLTGILGTVLLSIILLAVEFAATSIIGAIITGTLLAFLTILLTSTACLIKRLVRCDNFE
jgi:hypothetical protein